jgi:2-oxoglutarate dehydrogenase E2 component (dihydrolipoamide succinyltransferase)
MAIEIKVPVVGESISEVTIAKWLKSDSDFVEMDEVICEMESEKATFELNAEIPGILKLKAQEGDTVQIGDVICEIEESEKKEESASKGKIGKKEIEIDNQGSDIFQKTGQVIEMKVPTVGESITEVTISAWVKNDGEFVELDEVIAEIESEKATFELTAEAKGILHHKVKEGATLDIGGLICTIEEVSGHPVESKKENIKSEKTGDDIPVLKSYTERHPSPAAAKILSEKGLKPDEIIGSGPGGRILKEDAVKAVPTMKEGKITPPIEEGVASISHKHGKERNESRQKLSQLRKTVSRRLVAVKNETAMLTTFNEVNMAAIMDLRKKYKESFKEKYEVNLGFMSFFTKACCIALREWPSANAKIDGDEIVYYDFCDISIAVSAPKGLVVPVIRDAESLTFVEIEREVLNLATKARDNKLSIEEMTGGTFTITNGGVFGSMMSTPIINAPQSAILGMHNIVERPVVEGGEIVIRPMMYVALSYDHRIIDGRESVSFLVRVKQLLEDPSRLLLEI